MESDKEKELRLLRIQNVEQKTHINRLISSQRSMADYLKDNSTIPSKLWNEFIGVMISTPSQSIASQRVKDLSANAIVSYEKSKWIKYDKDDQSTWPATSAYGNPYTVIGYAHNRYIGCCYWNDHAEMWVVGGDLINGKRLPSFITHWTPLPKFEKNGE